MEYYKIYIQNLSSCFIWLLLLIIKNFSDKIKWIQKKINFYVIIFFLSEYIENMKIMNVFLNR